VSASAGCRFRHHDAADAAETCRRLLADRLPDGAEVTTETLVHGDGGFTARAFHTVRSPPGGTDGWVVRDRVGFIDPGDADAPVVLPCGLYGSSVVRKESGSDEREVYRVAAATPAEAAGTLGPGADVYGHDGGKP
jgi:hypothetical protein